MDDEPASAARTKKDSSLVRSAQAVRDGRAEAMVGAGNTGATMAAALLRIGRIRGIARPAIAVPIPVPGARTRSSWSTPAPTVDCTPEWLVQFARMGREYARTRLGIDEPTRRPALERRGAGQGRRAAQADVRPARRRCRASSATSRAATSCTATADVIVTDGFTGNVALKTLEGALRRRRCLVFRVLDSTPEAREARRRSSLPLLLEAADGLDPDITGGAVLLGVDGVCVISHGSSSARAIVNAARVARRVRRVPTCVQRRAEETVTDAG